MGTMKRSRKRGTGVKTVNIYEAKTHLSRLLKRVARGEEIIIGHDGKPVAKLVPYVQSGENRVLGLAAGQVRMAPDFDETPRGVIRLFEEGSITPR